MNQNHHPSIEKYRLKNGLTVILIPSSQAPVVSLQVGVKIGSAWETDAEAGLSHVLEHMVFKGTQSYAPGEIAQIVEASGGELNAYTSFDQTAYYINLSSRYWKKGLNLLKEMVLDATIDELELSRESEVILEEIRRGQDSPHRVISENLFGLAFQKHTYGRPVIGYDTTVKSFTAKIVKNFYKKWYTPSNMILVVSGDFKSPQIKKQIESEFGSYSSKTVQHPQLPREPQAKKVRFKIKQAPVQTHYLQIAFPIPDFKAPDTPALDLLSTLLGDGDTSRLEQEIKEKQGLVNHITTYAYTPRHPGLFVVDATLPLDKVNKALTPILEQLVWAKNHHFDSESLERAKQNYMSSVFYEKETCEGMARKIISYETTADDLNYEQEYLEKIQEITLEDIRYVAEKYLDFNQASIVLLRPQGKLGKSIKLPSSLFKASQQKKKKPYRQLQEQAGFKLFKLDNGIPILLKENHHVPLISLRLAGLGGLRYETTKNNGINHLMANLLSKGTQTKTALKISEINEQISGHVSGVSGKNSWGLSSSFLTAKKDLALELFFDMLLNPCFAPDEFNKEKRLAFESIKQQEDSPAHVAFKTFQSLLFQKHPFALSQLGTVNSVKSLNRNQIASFYQSLLNPREMALCAVGDFQTDEFIQQLNNYLKQLKPKRPQSLKVIQAKPAKKIQIKEIHQDKQQAHLVLGFLGLDFFNPDRYALEVLNHVLSGQGGRLFLELRDKQSLAYTVTSMINEGLDPGYLAVYMGTDPSKLDQALSGILHELNQIRNHKISAKELKRAQNYIVGNHEIDLQRNSAQASIALYYELYGQSLKEYESYTDKILNVSLDDVLRVAQKYLKMDAYTMALVRP